MSPKSYSARLSPSSTAIKHLSSRDRELFCHFGEGKEESPSFPTVIDAFEQMAVQYPNLIAATMVLEDGNLDHHSQISYEELNMKANKLATVLQNLGVANGDAVCLFLQRSIQMIVGIIAILKVGACYVPQHVGLAPDAQLLSIANSTEASVVLTMDGMENKLPKFSTHVSVIPIGKTVNEQAGSASKPRLGRPVAGSDCCYIIFTSGTTGAPKGVQVTHGNVANVLLTKPMNLGMGPGTRVSQILSIAFDMCAWEVLSCLSHGATLVVRHRSIANAVKFADIVISTPTVLGTLEAKEMMHVKTVAVAGEPCPRSLAAEWSKFARFYNSCGPTETTIVNTSKLFDGRADVLTIGKPTPNNTVYVLEPETLNPCKIGEIGEMWAGGECVSAGYLNRPDLTSEKYLPDPFVTLDGCLMYKTGDLGRWDENGELEHHGRVDDQVKVRGFRVELDGVSAMAEEGSGVTKAVVLKIGTELVAFVTPGDVDEGTVKDAIGRKLPYYCIPSRVLSLDFFPKTGNGKVDKRKLRSLNEGCCRQSTSNGYGKRVVAIPVALKERGRMSEAFGREFAWPALALLRRIWLMFASWQ